MARRSAGGEGEGHRCPRNEISMPPGLDCIKYRGWVARGLSGWMGCPGVVRATAWTPCPRVVRLAGLPRGCLGNGVDAVP